MYARDNALYTVDSFIVNHVKTRDRTRSEHANHDIITANFAVTRDACLLTLIVFYVMIIYSP